MDVFRLTELMDIAQDDALVTVNVDGYDVPVCGFTWDEKANAISLLLDEEFDAEEYTPDEGEIDEEEECPLGDVCNLPERSLNDPNASPEIKDL